MLLDDCLSSVDTHTEEAILEQFLERAAPVRSSDDARTPEGLFHMLGNVKEWTESVSAPRRRSMFQCECARVTGSRSSTIQRASGAWACTRAGAVPPTVDEMKSTYPSQDFGLAA